MWEVRREHRNDTSIEGDIFEYEASDVPHSGRKDEHENAEEDGDLALVEKCAEVGKRGAAKGNAQLEREMADIVSEVRGAACKDANGAHKVAVVDLDLLEKMKTGGRDKGVAGKGAVAESLAVVMEIVDDVVEELGWEYHGLMDRSWLGLWPGMSAA